MRVWLLTFSLSLICRSPFLCECCHQTFLSRNQRACGEYDNAQGFAFPFYGCVSLPPACGGACGNCIALGVQGSCTNRHTYTYPPSTYNTLYVLREMTDSQDIANQVYLARNDQFVLVPQPSLDFMIRSQALQFKYRQALGATQHTHGGQEYYRESIRKRVAGFVVSPTN